MAQYCHASHEVYHEGVAQRAHNLSPVPFGAAKRAKESSYHCSDTASQSFGVGFTGKRTAQYASLPALQIAFAALHQRLLLLSASARRDRQTVSQFAVASFS